MVLKFVKKHRFLIIISIIFLLFRLPSLFEPNWYGDEGIYLTIGLALRKGLVLYRQIHDNKPPTLYYLAAIGGNVFGFRLLLSLVMIPTLYAYYRLAGYFFNTKVARIVLVLFLILSSIPTVEGNIANAEIFMLLPTIYGVYLILKAKNWLNYFVGGLLLGIAFTIKSPVLFELAFLCGWIFINSFSLSNRQKSIQAFKNISLLVAGFMFPFLVWLVYFIPLNAVSQFFYAAFLQNFGYLSSWATGSHQNSVASGGLMGRGIALLASWMVIYLLRYRKIINSHLSFVLFWFSSAVFAALLSGRPYPHYLIQILPPLFLLIGFLFVAQVKKFYILFPLLLLGIIIIKFKFYFYAALPYYANFYSYSVGLKSQPQYFNYFGSRVNTDYQVASYLQTHARPSDHIFVWGDAPFIYVLTGLLPSGKYTVAYHIVDFNGYAATLDSFKTYLPSYIVYYPMPDRHFPGLIDFIDKYYVPDNLIGSVLIFHLR